MANTALFTSPMARKKRVDQRYAPNTFRVISQEADLPTVEPVIRTAKYSPPANINVLGQTTEQQTSTEYRHNRPNPKDVGFLRQDVALLNEPVCNVQTTSTKQMQSKWWHYEGSQNTSTNAHHTLDTTVRKDFQWRGKGLDKNTRHSSNPNINPAHGVVPVNHLRGKDGNQKVWKEGISYEHQYNSRGDPSYPIRGKRHGSFVWDQYPESSVKELLSHYGDQKVRSAKSEQACTVIQGSAAAERRSSGMPVVES